MFETATRTAPGIGYSPTIQTIDFEFGLAGCKKGIKKAFFTVGCPLVGVSTLQTTDYIRSRHRCKSLLNSHTTTPDIRQAP